MAEIVEPYLRETGFLQERLEAVLCDVAPIQELSGLRGEYEAVLAVERANPIYLLLAGA